MSSSRYSQAAASHDRRTFLRLAGCGGAALIAGRPLAGWASPATFDPWSISRMDFDVSYRTEVRDLPAGAERVQVWMPLPSGDEVQALSDVQVHCSLPHEETREEVYGNRIVHVRARGDSAPFVVEARYHVSRKRSGPLPARLGVGDRSKYLRFTPRVRVTDAVEAFAARAVGTARQPMEVGRRVFDAIVELLTYDKTIPGCGTGDTAWIMRHKRGKCDDFHALFMAVMVSRGIPVRWEQGFPLPLPQEEAPEAGRLEGDCTGAHCWASFFDPEAGWVPVDVSEADKIAPHGDRYFGQLTPNRFKVSEGRSIVLKPAQGGGPLSTFAFAYAEADGLPLIYAANYENVIQYRITGVETS